jgi:hypothetical protein
MNQKRNKTRSMTIAVCIVLIATSLPLMHMSAWGVEPKNISLSYSFVFDEPIMHKTSVDASEYTVVHMSGCLAMGKNAGAPMLPVKSVKLLLPARTMVSSVTVGGTTVELEGVDAAVFPYQNPVPFGFDPEPFQFNSAVYTSDVLYPLEISENLQIGYCRGYAILDLTLNPMQYLPSEGRLFFYPEITVTISLEETGMMNPFFRNNPDDKAWVQQLVYNPEVVETYTGFLPTFEYPGGLCDPSEHYDYVIITTMQNGLYQWQTNETVPYNWWSLIQKHEQDDGLRCTIVTIQDITACLDYHSADPLFNDLPAHIREFCKDAYQDWGTQYIFIGGDDEWIPARHMKYEYEMNVDSDLYWSNLDKTFNANHNSLWGEEGDLGFDLYSELFIGRITCDEPQDVSNWMTKSFSYASALEADYLENAAFYGGDTTWLCEGDDFIDYGAIKGTSNWLGPSPGSHGYYPSWLGFQYGFETWNSHNPNNQYNLSVKWTAEPPNPGWMGGSESAAVAGLKDAINNNEVTLLSGIAHAYEMMSLDVTKNDWESNYHNTQPFFIYDFGCHCGDMDAADDGVLHSMLFHSDTELAFACVYNTCYGWGSFSDTNSSSALLMKLFWDYLFDTVNNSGDPVNWTLGKAHAWSKDAMAPTINWTYSGAPGSWRAVIQGCLLFGDPAQRIKPMTRPPEVPEAPSGPVDGLINVKYTYSTCAVDPDNDQVYYQWDWGDGTQSEWLGPYVSGEITDALHSWDYSGTYEIQVKAKDIHHLEGSWSDSLRIYVVDVPVLEIQSIGGSLFKVSVVIRNNGSTAANGVDWSITLDGGSIFLGKKSTGRVITIPAGDEVTVTSNVILGLGKTLVTVTAENSASSDSKQQEAFVLLFYIKTPT